MQNVAQEYINLVESLFDRDPQILSLEDYEFYLKVEKRNLELDMSRTREIREYYETRLHQ